jgi:hypothetical protein
MVGVAGLPEVFVFYFMLDGFKSGTGLHCGSGYAKEKVAIPVPQHLQHLNFCSLS